MKERKLSDNDIIIMGFYIVTNNATMRQTAKVFGISKSTVYQYIVKYLEDIDYSLYDSVLEVVSLNKSERHFRGGEATKNKYKKLKGE